MQPLCSRNAVWHPHHRARPIGSGDARPERYSLPPVPRKDTLRTHRGEDEATLAALSSWRRAQEHAPLRNVLLIAFSRRVSAELNEQARAILGAREGYRAMCLLLPMARISSAASGLSHERTTTASESKMERAELLKRRSGRPRPAASHRRRPGRPSSRYFGGRKAK